MVRYVKEATKILQAQYDGEVPQDIDQLCALPGVGEKIAFLTLLHAWELYESSVHPSTSLV